MWQYRYTPDPDVLMHYGVKGMKWGVRRNPRRAYSKLAKEEQKRIRKENKLLSKYGNAELKAAYKKTKRARRKADKALQKARKEVKKNNKWYQDMDAEMHKDWFFEALDKYDAKLQRKANKASKKKPKKK